jgi:asparagine synthase (glutamine-hydrolysing)
MIMAWQRSAPGSLPCYTFGGTFHDSQDVVIARQIARVCGQPHDVIRAGQEFLDRFSRYAQRTVYLTDGCADVSRSPVLYVNEQAAKIAPIRMTGNYGGEVMRQLRPFKPDGLTPALFHPEFHSYINMAKRTYAGLRMGRPPSFAVFQQAPWHHYGLLALEQTQVSLRSPYLDNDFVRTVFRSPAPAFQRKDESLRLIADGNPDLLAIRTDRGHHAGGRHGLSARVVREFLEFTFKAEYAYNYGMPQWLARIDHVLAPFHLERLFLGRHKYYHFRVWYRDALADYVRDMLLDKRALSRPFVDRKTVEAFVRGHLRGDRNYTTEIHKLLTLELIHRLFLD